MEKFEFFKHNKDFKAFEQGQTIFEQGEAGNLMFVVTEGKVDIVVGGKIVEVVEEGGVFGEMAVVDNMPRSASAVAASTCKIVPVTQEQFNFMVQNNPFFTNKMMKVMSQRLRNTNPHDEAIEE
jgi:CRP/FNR family transcriptional regulator, cyclic AMP receptor protein